MRKEMRKMMPKIAAMRKMMRKAMRKIVFMRKVEILSSEGKYSRSEQHKAF